MFNPIETETALREFVTLDLSEQNRIPDILEVLLTTIKLTGKPTFDWALLRPLVAAKMKLAISEMQEKFPYNDEAVVNVENISYSELRDRVLNELSRFETGAPFTIQRICELICSPARHYSRCDKFLRALERSVKVVSELDRNGEKIRIHSTNDMDENGQIVDQRPPTDQPTTATTATENDEENVDNVQPTTSALLASTNSNNPLTTSAASPRRSPCRSPVPSTLDVIQRGFDDEPDVRMLIEAASAGHDQLVDESSALRENFSTNGTDSGLEAANGAGCQRVGSTKRRLSAPSLVDRGFNEVPSEADSSRRDELDDGASPAKAGKLD